MLWSTNARAEGGPFGLGIIVGQPTGLTAAFELSENTMIDAALGLELFDNRDFYLHVEFDYFLPTLVSGSSVSLDGYLGIGGFFANHNDPVIGARAPFGLSLWFTNVPLQLFAELSLLLPITPDVDLHVRGAGGFRYYF